MMLGRRESRHPSRRRLRVSRSRGILIVASKLTKLVPPCYRRDSVGDPPTLRDTCAETSEGRAAECVHHGRYLWAGWRSFEETSWIRISALTTGNGGAC